MILLLFGNRPACASATYVGDARFLQVRVVLTAEEARLTVSARKNSARLHQTRMDGSDAC